MNERIQELMLEAGKTIPGDKHIDADFCKKFAELIVQECIDKIETYRIPVGNSASGELACEYTYAALKEIRDEIKEHFAVD